VGAAGGHPAFQGQGPGCPGGDVQANQPQRFPNEKLNFALSKKVQSFLSTKKKQPQQQPTKPKKPTQDCRSCLACTAENLGVLDVTFPFSGLILLLISVERRF